MKIKKSDSLGYDEWWCQWWLCTKCNKNYIAPGFNYCPNCGEKIEWEEC